MGAKTTKPLRDLSLRAPQGAWQSAVNHFSTSFLYNKSSKADRHVALKGSSRWQNGNGTAYSLFITINRHISCLKSFK